MTGLSPAYITRAAPNLLPLSREQQDFHRAVREWAYNGVMQDHGEPIEFCQLCGQEGVRYHFRIDNAQTKNELWIGSECIQRFGIEVRDTAGNPLAPEEAGAKVRGDRRALQEAARAERIKVTLRKLWRVDPGFREKIEDIVKYIDKREALTPSQMLLIQWRLASMGIPHSPRDFKVVLRRDREKDQIRELSDWKYQKLATYLSEAQRTLTRGWRV